MKNSFFIVFFVVFFSKINAQDHSFVSFLNTNLGVKTVLISIEDIKSESNSGIATQLKDRYQIEAYNNILSIEPKHLENIKDKEKTELISLLSGLHEIKYNLSDNIDSREKYNQFSGDGSVVGKRMQTKAVTDGLIKE